MDEMLIKDDDVKETNSWEIDKNSVKVNERDGDRERERQSKC